MKKSYEFALLFYFLFGSIGGHKFYLNRPFQGFLYFIMFFITLLNIIFINFLPHLNANLDTICNFHNHFGFYPTDLCLFTSFCSLVYILALLIDLINLEKEVEEYNSSVE